MVYLKADPQYEGRVTVPTLWDRRHNTVVNNESSEIIRMLYTAFDHLLPPHRREASKGPAGLLPDHLREPIDAMNAWVYDTVNNGVYKCGFATAQKAYDASILPLFESLDRIEAHLAEDAHQPYLFGEHITEADIRLFPTIARFDTAYYTLFKCNIKMIRHDYPRIDRWMRGLYWDESERTGGGAFKKTTKVEKVSGWSRGKREGGEKEMCTGSDLADKGFLLVEVGVLESGGQWRRAGGPGAGHPTALNSWDGCLEASWQVRRFSNCRCRELYFFPLEA
ncbi:hypothetical protein SLS55_003850 [Diplodia seriata]|uniref:GST C-terminal domain-containing protein n=1 Tax=Diplodia seriata TaxID=420778 RepID=A0ABR3CSA4_9PEZI